MTETSQAVAAAPARQPRAFALRDLGLAPENLRFDEAPDDEIPLLADTILAAGLMQPLTVRPGRKTEKAAMVLDGRRRLLALARLRDQGAIDEAYQVSAFVETDRARQAAAVVLTNTAVPVHVADVIAAIGKMLKAKLAVPAIAAALGYGEIEVRRLAALAGLSAEALAALKAGRMTLRQAKLLARLPDAEARAEIVALLAQGYGFPEYRLSQTLERGQVTRSDRRFVLVGEARYAAAGGRIETDLFGELPDVLLDPELLDGLWIDRAKALAGQLGRALAVVATTEPDPAWPEDLEPYGYDDVVGLDAAEIAALREAEAGAGAALAALAGLDLGDAAADPALIAYIEARLRAEQAEDPRRDVTQILLHPGRVRPIEVQAFAPAAERPEEDGGDPDGAGGNGASQEDELGESGAAAAAEGPQAPAPAPPPGPETEGASHALHEVRTDLATRVLIRALADDPRTAFTACVARLFSAAMLHLPSGEGSASTLSLEVYGKPRARSVEALDGDVRRRLADRRVAWRESGLTVIAWAHALPAADQMALLAELVALSLDLSEPRTTAIRNRAQQEAAELAGLCSAEASRWWTPDDAFLRAHSKTQLLAMLTEMGEPDGVARSLKKEELVTLVAQTAAARRWAPACLSWRPDPTDLAGGTDPADGAGEDPAPLAA
jgi:ParB family chromosome partitioning protein